MQVCPKCGKPIKYIASGFSTTETCEPEKVEVVSEGGHILRGYMRHSCGKMESDDDEKRRD